MDKKELEKKLKEIDDRNKARLASLGKEEREKILKEREEFDKEFNDFWSKEYPRLSIKERKRYWLSGTHRGMRSQGEAFADEYSHFSKKWYEHSKGVEPKFDKIFKYVTENLGFKFDWDEYHKRIKE